MKKAFVQLHVAILLASCSGIFGKLITLNEILITFYRMLFAGIMLFIFLMLTGTIPKINRSNLKISALGFLVAIHWIFFYGSIKYANVSVGVVCFCLSGFFTALFTPLVKKSKLSVIELCLGSLTVAGILLIFRFDSSFRTGIILGVISAMLFALFALLNEKINQVHKNVASTTMFQMLGGAIGIGILLPVYLLFFPSVFLMPDLDNLLLLIILALFCTVFMYLLLNKAQQQISAFTVSLSFNLEPLYGIVLAVLIFHEHKELSPAFYAGLALILLSLILQTYRFSAFKQNSVN